MGCSKSKGRLIRLKSLRVEPYLTSEDSAGLLASTGVCEHSPYLRRDKACDLTKQVLGEGRHPSRQRRGELAHILHNAWVQHDAACASSYVLPVNDA